MRTVAAVISLLLAACAGPSAPVEPSAMPAAPAASAVPVGASTAPSVVAMNPNEPPKAKSPARFEVTTAMAMDGKIDDKALVAEVNAQLETVSACAPIVRRTDSTTGSLNLGVTIAKDGTTKPSLQSPTSEAAKACILAAVAKWKLSPKVGAGSAMVLLSFVE